MLSFSSSTRLDLMDHGGSARKNRATAKLVKCNVAGAGTPYRQAIPGSGCLGSPDQPFDASSGARKNQTGIARCGLPTVRLLTRAFRLMRSTPGDALGGQHRMVETGQLQPARDGCRNRRRGQEPSHKIADRRQI